MTRLSTHVQATQREQAHTKQVKNSAGGFSFVLDDWKRLEQFLILGSEGGTYYVNERKLTRENAAVVQRCLNADGPRAVEVIASISEAGRAPKNDPAIFALAIAASNSSTKDTRDAALAALPRVCRIGTHLFSFIDDVEKMRGWGTDLRQAVAKWYLDKPADKLAYQVVKYRQRGGRSHRDVLRLAHPQAEQDGHKAIFRWIVTGSTDMGERKVYRKAKNTHVVYDAIPEGSLPRLIEGFEKLNGGGLSEKDVAHMVEEFGFTHEMLPTEFKNSKVVWDALLHKMPITALIRNLNKMTAVGTLSPMSEASKLVIARIMNGDILKKGRVHPVALLIAQKVYASGAGVKGNLTWTPVKQVVDALNEGFYLAFDAIEPTGKNSLLAIDVSGSMGWTSCVEGLMCSEGAAAMAMVTARKEQSWDIMGFESVLRDLGISPTMRLDTVLKKMQSNTFGGTDCSLPMRYALERKLEVDAFYVYTDSETWAGTTHPHEELERYRQKMGRPAKLVVIGMASTGFSIANPDDTGMLDVVGFDASAPAVMADFVR